MKLIPKTTAIFLLGFFLQTNQAFSQKSTPSTSTEIQKAFYLGPNLSWPVGKTKLGSFSTGISAMGIFQKKMPWALATEAGWLHLFSKSYKNSTGQTFHTKPINDFYIQTGPRYYITENKYFADLMFGAHTSFSNGTHRSSKPFEYINDITFNLGYHNYLTSGFDISIIIFFGRFVSNGDGLNFAGLKFLIRLNRAKK